MRMSVFYDHILQAMEQTGKSLEVLLQEVREAGITAVEIRLEYLLAHEEILDALKQADLEISCIYEFYEMDKRDESEKSVKHIQAAESVGAKKILVVPGFLHGLEARWMQHCMANPKKVGKFFSKNAKIKCMVEGLSYIAKLGKEKDVQVTVEDFDDIHSPLSGMHGIHWFLQQIPELSYTLDTGNYLFYHENMLEAYELLKDRIVHVHCKDRRQKNNASIAVGSGYIPFAEVIARLQKQGYEGYLAVEHFDVENQENCIKKSADMLRNMLK